MNRPDPLAARIAVLQAQQQARLDLVAQNHAHLEKLLERCEREIANLQAIAAAGEGHGLVAVDDAQAAP
jgi:sugar (pentulose or hexulose) kinase